MKQRFTIKMIVKRAFSQLYMHKKSILNMSSSSDDSLSEEDLKLADTGPKP